MYIVVRSDLSPGLQAAQAVHAGFFFAQTYPEITREWLSDSQYLVIVAADSSEEILALNAKASSKNIPTSLWSEPDLNGEVTAVALAPGSMSRILCANLPLAGNQRKKPSGIPPTYSKSSEYLSSVSVNTREANE